MGVLDVQRYYPSIDMCFLYELLVALGAPPSATDRLCSSAAAFSRAAGVTGIPIGPEASGPLGNAHLVPLDAEFERMRLAFYRLTDDVWVFPRDAETWESAVRRCDVVLAALGLDRSAEKTDFYPDPVLALAHVADPAISVAESWLDYERTIALEGLRDLLDLVADDPWPTPTRFRAALKFSSSLTDLYAASLLGLRPELMQVDPAAVGRYLLVVTRKSRRQLEPFVAMLEEESTDRTEAVHLHILRAATVTGWGKDERQLFESIGHADHRPGLLRAWAFLASLRGNPKLAAAAVDLATDDRVPFALRRSAVVGVQALDAGKRTKVCDHVRARCPDLVPTVRMIELLAA